tara:strand:- start:4050 stop:4460 length:411 start_codon:yes stop_codon:yes gene_type:complete
MSYKKVPGTFAWWFQRISGSFLIILIFIHFIDVHFIMGVENLEFDAVSEKWNKPIWRIMDALMLVFGMIHGANGIESILYDFKKIRKYEKYWVFSLRAVALVTIVLGSWVILTFSPSESHKNESSIPVPAAEEYHE